MAINHVGIISIGEMGYHWAKLLKSKGVAVSTCLDGRSEVTKKRAENAGVRPISSLTQLISECDLIVSVVVPSAAIQVAESISEVLSDVDKKDFLFLDANAISPMTAHQIEEKFRPHTDTFIDGCIIGSSKKLTQNAVVYVSGPQAERMRELETVGFSVRTLGQDIGQASAFKIIYAGLTKGLQGLLVELLTGANKLNILDQIMECYDERFPGLMGKVGRNIAALPVHAERRAEEMKELAQTFRHYDLEAVMPPAVRNVLKSIAYLNLGQASENGERKWTLTETLEALHDKGFLQKQTESGCSKIHMSHLC